MTVIPIRAKSPKTLLRREESDVFIYKDGTLSSLKLSMLKPADIRRFLSTENHFSEHELDEKLRELQDYGSTTF